MFASTTPIVVVTGANTGIGFETVRALVSGIQPYTVILCSRSIEKGQAAAGKLQSEIKQGSQIIPLQLDIKDDASIELFVKDVEQRFGRLDVLINNAGTYRLYHLIIFALTQGVCRCWPRRRQRKRHYDGPRGLE